VVWCALLLGDERALERGTALAEAGGRVPQARAELRRAGAHTASADPQLRESQLELFAGRPAAAVRLLRGVVAREPENVVAWRLLAGAAKRAGDQALAGRARVRLSALDPRSGR